jgi:GNAT superfamily N-acetyltransferase
MNVQLRPMREEDAAKADEIMQTALAEVARRLDEDAKPFDHTRQHRMVSVLRHFIATDPEGCWVALRGEEMVGMATAIRRGRLWGLGLLFILPQAQGLGIGRALLDACARYAEGCDCKMIMTSTDPKATRTYAAHGLDVHPAMIATGTPDASRLQAAPGVRPGSTADLPLVQDVDTIVRGGSRALDVEFLLTQDATLSVIDDQSGRGYAVHAPGSPVVGGHPMMLSATTQQAACHLLRQALADAREPVEIFGLTSRQSWAIRIALEAKLTVSPGSPLCLTPGIEPPGPWLLSGIYF